MWLPSDTARRHSRVFTHTCPNSHINHTPTKNAHTFATLVRRSLGARRRWLHITLSASSSSFSPPTLTQATSPTRRRPPRAQRRAPPTRLLTRTSSQSCTICRRCTRKHMSPDFPTLFGSMRVVPSLAGSTAVTQRSPTTTSRSHRPRPARSATCGPRSLTSSRRGRWSLSSTSAGPSSVDGRWTRAVVDVGATRPGRRVRAQRPLQGRRHLLRHVRARPRPRPRPGQ